MKIYHLITEFFIYTAAHLKWNALRALLQIAGWYLVVEHTNCSILNVQRSKYLNYKYNNLNIFL